MTEIDLTTTAQDHPDENDRIPILLSTLVESGTMENFFSSWLQMLSLTIPAFVQGLVFVAAKDKEKEFAPVSMWPVEGSLPQRIVEVTEKSLQDNCGLVVRLDDREGVSGNFYAVALPVTIDTENVCTVAVELGVEKESQLKELMEKLQWAVSWPEVFFRRSIMKSEDLKIKRMKSAIDLMANLQSKKKWREAAVGFVTDLSVILACDRVSTGFVRGRKVKIGAISNSASIGRKMNLVTAIEEAMHEAVIMKAPVIFPSDPDDDHLSITKMHEALSNPFGKGAVLSIPFYYQGRYTAVLTLERPTGEIFSSEDVDYCKGICALVFPALLEKRENDRVIFKKIVDSFFSAAGVVLGKQYIGKKILVLLLIAAGIFFYYQEGEYRLAANCVLECETKQVAAVPFNGYIAESSVRPGDRVEPGQMLCRLDDRDLKLEQINYLTQKAQFEKQYQSEMAAHNTAEAKVIKTRIDQAVARIDQVKSKINRTRILSPFTGMIVSGDLTRRLGGFVEQGEPIFEIAPLDRYRLILRVDESRINDVRQGLVGSVVLFSMPREKFEFKVTRMTPISMAEEGLNYFRVEAVLIQLSEKMRPGMEGIGKVTISQDRYYRIWTRSLIEWGRMTVWKWFK